MDGNRHNNGFIMRMTKNEFADAKTLWKMFYARESFKQVESACSYTLGPAFLNAFR